MFCPLFLSSALLVAASFLVGQEKPPEVLRSGRLEIPQSRAANIALGLWLPVSDEAADFGFQARSAQDRYLTPLHGAALANVGVSPPEFAKCANIILSSDPIALRNLDKGTHMCIRTAEGRYGWFRIEDLVPDNPRRPDMLTLVITFEVWNNPRIALVDEESTRSIHYKGDAEIVQTFAIDLDERADFTPGGIWSNDWDLWFEAVSDNVRYLVPVNGATAGIIGKTAAGYSGCSATNFSRASVPITEAMTGMWICIKTNKGRYSEIEIREIRTHRNQSRASVYRSLWTLVISYKTWD